MIRGKRATRPVNLWVLELNRHLKYNILSTYCQHILNILSRTSPMLMRNNVNLMSQIMLLICVAIYVNKSHRFSMLTCLWKILWGKSIQAPTASLFVQIQTWQMCLFHALYSRDLWIHSSIRLNRDNCLHNEQMVEYWYGLKVNN